MRLNTPTLALAALAALILVDQVLRSSAHLGSPPPPAPVVESDVRSHRAALPARTDPALVTGPGDSAQPAMDVAAIRATLQASGNSTYLSAMLTETDSLIRRWTDSDVVQLRVTYTIDPLPNWSPDDQQIARAAFAEWERLELPIRFREMVDTAGAQIEVRWVPHFDIDRSGQADLQWDQSGRISHAVIQLALKDQHGRLISPEGLRAVALHEVGHALGLPHSDRPEDLMFPTTRRPVLSARDTLTIRLLYHLPPSSIKWPAPSSSP